MFALASLRVACAFWVPGSATSLAPSSAMAEYVGYSRLAEESGYYSSPNGAGASGVGAGALNGATPMPVGCCGAGRAQAHLIPRLTSASHRSLECCAAQSSFSPAQRAPPPLAMPVTVPVVAATVAPPRVRATLG